MNKINFTKVYGYIGKALCGIAGGIVAFVTGGVYWVIPGILVGGVAGYFLERQVAHRAL